jgi:purine-binding chemotaxis protein CheW
MEDILHLHPGAGQPAHSHAPELDVEARQHELMTLSLGGHLYGMALGCVIDVRDAQPPMQLFNRPACHVGAIWIAGEHAPVIDLRLALGLKPERGSRHPIVAIDLGERVIGATVDAVGEVLSVPGHEVSPSDATSGPIEPRFLRGESRTPQGHALTLVDIPALLTYLNELFEVTSA